MNGNLECWFVFFLWSMAVIKERYYVNRKQTVLYSNVDFEMVNINFKAKTWMLRAQLDFWRTYNSVASLHGIAGRNQRNSVLWHLKNRLCSFHGQLLFQCQSVSEHSQSTRVSIVFSFRLYTGSIIMMGFYEFWLFFVWEVCSSLKFVCIFRWQVKQRSVAGFGMPM